ncbi:hypothetical protein HYW66_00415 [Candidatus Microgenomates bacterium]|nr:hypothetical protein [Candidatus Microgenomates bacterium]
MTDLSQRQKQILQSIIEEYTETGEPVGSETLDKKYNLGVSPATLRNEMVNLTTLGYLKKPHTSAGRTPTPLSFRFYIKELMQEKKLSVAQEVSMREKIWDYRERLDKLLQEATRELAEQTKSLAVATTDDGLLYSAGYANMLEMPEFYDFSLTRRVLSVLDSFDFFNALFEKFTPEDDINIILGEQLGSDLLSECSLVFVEYKTPKKHSGTIGVLGPARLRYSSIIPTVRYFGDLIEEVAKSW